MINDTLLGNIRGVEQPPLKLKPEQSLYPTRPLYLPSVDIKLSGPEKLNYPYSSNLPPTEYPPNIDINLVDPVLNYPPPTKVSREDIERDQRERKRERSKTLAIQQAEQREKEFGQLFHGVVKDYLHYGYSGIAPKSLETYTPVTSQSDVSLSRVPEITKLTGTSRGIPAMYILSLNDGVNFRKVKSTFIPEPPKEPKKPAPIPQSNPQPSKQEIEKQERLTYLDNYEKINPDAMAFMSDEDLIEYLIKNNIVEKKTPKLVDSSIKQLLEIALSKTDPERYDTKMKEIIINLGLPSQGLKPTQAGPALKPQPPSSFQPDLSGLYGDLGPAPLRGQQTDRYGRAIFDRGAAAAGQTQQRGGPPSAGTNIRDVMNRRRQGFGRKKSSQSKQSGKGLKKSIFKILNS